jgi:hypothetical protein
MLTSSAWRSVTQDTGTIPAHTKIRVRTIEAMDTQISECQLFRGVVDRDVFGGNGNVLISKGSEAELIVRSLPDGDLALDLESVMINGQRFGVETGNEAITAARLKSDGLPNGAEVVAIGKRIDVPVQSVLNFGLAEPFHVEAVERRETQTCVVSEREKPSYSGSPWSITIGPDQNIVWRAPQSANVYVQVDNQEAKLFASAQSGTQAAPFMASGHRYVFILKDLNGNDIARTEQDLR